MRISIIGNAFFNLNALYKATSESTYMATGAKKLPGAGQVAPSSALIDHWDGPQSPGSAVAN